MHNGRLSLPTLPFLLALFSFSSSCWFGRKPAVFTPPPTRTQPQVATKPPVVAAEPPLIEGNPSATIPSAPADIPEIPAPPAPKPQPRRGTAPPPQPKPIPTTTPPPVEQPRLGQIFTPEELRQYNRAIDDSLTRVRRALDVLARKNLNADQQMEVGRIATFQKQAEQAREAQDLLTAKNLAERADTLAQDLLGRIP